MRLEKYERPDSSGRYRNLMMAALAATAIGVNGCGPGTDTNGNDAGTAGTAGNAGEGGTDAGGSAGTGGTDAGGTGGQAGGNNCDELTFDGLGSKVFQPNTTGVLTLTGLQGTAAAYNNMSVTVVNGEIFTQPTMLAMDSVTIDNAPTGYGQVGDLKGIRIQARNPEHPFKPNPNGIGCVEDYLPLNATAMANPSKQPLVYLPGVRNTVFNVRNDIATLTAYELSDTGTTYHLDAITSASGTVDQFAGNSLPAGTDPKVFINQAGKLEVYGPGVTDEGSNSTLVLNNLNPSVPGHSFILKSPGVYESAAPFAGSTADLSWSGLNAALTNDTRTKTLNVYDCNDHGTFNTGTSECECDPGFADIDNDPVNDCNKCDTESGLYEDDYPLCSNDVTPPTTPEILTGSGDPIVIHQADFVINGTASSDTDELWVKAVQTSIPGAGAVLFDWQKVNGYPPNTVDWQYNGNIAEIWKAYDYCFRAEDKANNQSGENCLNVNRVP